MGYRSRLLFAAGLCWLWASPAAAEEAVAGASIESNAGGVSAESVQVAEPGSPPVQVSGWEFAVTPYLWMSGTKADIDTPQGESIKVDESFIDILGNLKFAFMGSFEAKNGRFVAVQDLMYLSLGTSADGHIGPIPLDADADLKLLTTTHLFGYRVVDNGPMFVDLFAGGRITSIKVGLDLTGPLQTIERDRKTTQFGPVIASRVRFPLSDNWGVALYGDLGGFGVGADLSWQMLGTVQYEISERWRLAAGWRHFSAKQSKNDWDVHMKLDGPILGATYRF